MVMPLSATSPQAGELGLGKFAVTMGANLAGPPVIRVGSYDPSKVYEGAHEPERIYNLVPDIGVWQANYRPALLQEVTCRDAKRALEQQGVWLGWLAQDGACRSGKGTRWATGNYLNFETGPQTSDVHL
jgi:hypothetical protein